ncbi:hypothetical protein GGR55DRAFT_550770 [Xylaria sp. FL0064]|nr:hypothetical protein GGR55DRAFT_550770 [Xylaria sp. FL0064]
MIWLAGNCRSPYKHSAFPAHLNFLQNHNNLRLFLALSHYQLSTVPSLQSSLVTISFQAQVIMSPENGATIPEDPTKTGNEAGDVKGKGKAVAAEEPVDQSMDEDDDEESGDEEVS